jgi:hypothetical protein
MVWSWRFTCRDGERDGEPLAVRDDVEADAPDGQRTTGPVLLICRCEGSARPSRRACQASPIHRKFSITIRSAPLLTSRV